MMASGNKLRWLVALVASTRISPLMMTILLCETAMVVAAAAFAVSAFFTEASPATPGIEWKAPTLAHVPPKVGRSNKVYLHTLSRPIFSKTRRPPSAASANLRVPEPAALPPPPGVSLKGIVSYKSMVRAFLTSANSPQGEWKTIGDKLGSWTVDRIERDHLALKNGTRSLKYSLYPELDPDAVR
jgi:hypothetical protein